jgi:hypothetical protein
VRDGDPHVVGFVGGLLNGQCRLLQLPGTGEVAKASPDVAEAAEGDGHAGMVGAICGLVDPQRSLLVLAGAGEVAEAPQDPAQVGKRAGHLGVVRSVCSLLGCKCSLLEFPGSGKVAEVQYDIAEVPQLSLFGSRVNSTPRAFSSSYVFWTLSLCQTTGEKPPGSCPGGLKSTLVSAPPIFSSIQRMPSPYG